MGREKTQQISSQQCSFPCWLLSALLKGSSGRLLPNLSAFCAVSHLGSAVRTKFSFACNQQTSTSSAEHWTNPVLGYFFTQSLFQKKTCTSNPLIGLFFRTHILWSSFFHYFTEDSLNIRGEKVPLEQKLLEQSLECVCLGFFHVLGKHTSGISAFINGSGWCLLRKQ